LSESDSVLEVKRNLGQIRALRNILAQFQPFDFVLAEFAEFPGDGASTRERHRIEIRE
jgi:hypothetical protein